MNRTARRYRRLTTAALLRLYVLSIATTLLCITALLACEPRQATSTPARGWHDTVPATPTSTSTTSSTSTTTTVADVPATLPPALTEVGGKCPEWVPILIYVGFPEAELPTADRILWAESRCSNDAVNPLDWGGGSWCGFQIHRPSWEAHLIEQGIISSWDDLTQDPVACAAAAFHIYTRAQGWHPWSTY